MAIVSIVAVVILLKSTTNSPAAAPSYLPVLQENTVSDLQDAPEAENKNVGGQAVKIPPTCSNGKKNGQETDIDCGGKKCPGCAIGKKCKKPTDCLSNVCNMGICAEPSPTCIDGKKNGNEVDLDCGGYCSPCAAGKACNQTQPYYCTSNNCLNNICQVATCTDKIKNQDESDIDCGGLICPKCPHAYDCKFHEDCQEGKCYLGFCTACTDNTNICDDCLNLANGNRCECNYECASENCDSSKNFTCSPDPCFNGIKDGQESDIDCGGDCPTSCEIGQSCISRSDCATGVCIDGTCKTPTCINGKIDGTESDIDCGGASCGTRCVIGKVCKSASDCLSGVCAGKCKAATCTDGLWNQGESDVDCGGPTACSRCSNGRLCRTSSDCSNGRCVVEPGKAMRCG